MNGSVELKSLVHYCDTLLSPEKFQDYVPNGLQVEGRSLIKRVMTGVTANLALLESAVKWDADVVLVHHGYFWRNEPVEIVGFKAKRIRLLMQHEMSLLAYHLPLDAHTELGNNAQLAKKMGWQVAGIIPDGTKTPLVYHGIAPTTTPALFSEQLTAVLGRAPLHIPGCSKTIERIAWCTGAAQHALKYAADLNFDAYITGEVSESTVHVARETGIHFFAAGHHATERYGIVALGEHLAQHFGILHQFQDIDNPV